MNYATIILAAGQSSRLGRAKQLLIWQGKSFVEHTFDLASTVVSEKQIIIVTGGRKELVEEHLIEKGLPFIHNPNWEEGMGSSIRVGVNHLLQAVPNIDGILIMVCDQVKIQSTDLQNLLNAHQANQDKVIAAQYLGRVGVPAVFPQTWFSVLSTLEGDRGARFLLRKRPDEVISIDLPNAAFDVDTEEDYRELLGLIS